jgi:hypothetical protein
VAAPGWSTSAVWFDYDNDGRLDLAVGSFVEFDKSKNQYCGDGSLRWYCMPTVYKGAPCRLFHNNGDGTFTDVSRETAEPMLLFRNDGAKWTNVSAQSGPIFAKDLAARGLALGDFDNDGSVDVLVTVNDGPPVLMRNHAGRRNHWLGVRLVGRTANRDAIGAKVTYRSGDFQRHRSVSGGCSYLSSHDPRVVLGLGQRAKVDWLEIKWPLPSGKVERFGDLPVDRYITIVEGEGRWK